MGELGEDEIRYHRELGQYINLHKRFNKGAEVISVGTLSKYITDEITNSKAKHFENIESAAAYIKTIKPLLLFLKASRSMKFEQIIELLQ